MKTRKEKETVSLPNFYWIKKGNSILLTIAYIQSVTKSQMRTRFFVTPFIALVRYILYFKSFLRSVPRWFPNGSLQKFILSRYSELTLRVSLLCWGPVKIPDEDFWWCSLLISKPWKSMTSLAYIYKWFDNFTTERIWVIFDSTKSHNVDLGLIWIRKTWRICHDVFLWTGRKVPTPEYCSTACQHITYMGSIRCHATCLSNFHCPFRYGHYT